jgi:hypothetical protein
VLREDRWDSVWLLAGSAGLTAGLLGLFLPETGTHRGEPSAAGGGWLPHRDGLLPGVVLGMGLFGFGGFNAFIALYALDIGLDAAGPLFALFAIVVVTVRSLGAKIPDRLGPLRTVGIRDMEEGDGILPAALEIGNYYDAVGHNDIVYRVERHFEANPESISEHEVVVIDEYQDFNYLETRLIDSLAQASPVLIAGDDDQALYGFKGSSPRFIRDLANEEEVELFDLPYCSRCTEVVVEAVTQIVVEAQRGGNLADRIKRPYLCYLPDKAEDSDRHPALIHAACSVENNRVPYARKYIAEQIAEIPEEDIRESREGPHPTALVIGPLHYVRPICEYLAERFANVRLLQSAKGGITALDGYRRLARDFDSRLGWRILLYVKPCDGASDRIERALQEKADLVALLPDEYRERHRRPAALVERLLDGEDLTADEIAELETATDMTIDQIHVALGTDPEEEGDEGAEGYDEEPEEDEGPTIVCTSQVGAKGLSAEHVFIVGMVNGDIPRDPNNVTDDEVCQLIVSLSRTRKACHLVSAGNWLGAWKKESAFFKWLGDIATERREINKDYWNE